MNVNLISEADELHRQLAQALLTEERQYTKDGKRRTVNQVRLAKLEHARNRAADRWRRRSGYPYRWQIHREADTWPMHQRHYA